MSDIVLKNLTKRFGSVTAVDNLSLEIPSASFTTFLGPSGCGKTTTLRMLAGLETPTSGEIWIGGTCVFSKEKGMYVPPGKRRLGLVFQSYALWPHLKVFDNIAFGLKIAKEPSDQVKKRTTEVASILQIGELLERYPSELSGGQQQRVAIARVLVTKPSVLLLDEPLSNLDSKLRMDMRAELKRLHLETGSTIIYVTHDQLEALTMSSDVAILDKGLLQQWAPPMTLYNKPANLFTADFIGNPRINLMKGVLASNGNGKYHMALGAGDIPIPLASQHAGLLGKELTVGLRPEDLVLSKEPRADFLEGSIHSILPAGSEWFVRIELGPHVLMAREYKDPKMNPDDPVWVGVVEDRVKCFDNSGELL